MLAVRGPDWTEQGIRSAKKSLYQVHISLYDVGFSRVFNVLENREIM